MKNKTFAQLFNEVAIINEKMWRLIWRNPLTKQSAKAKNFYDFYCLYHDFSGHNGITFFVRDEDLPSLMRHQSKLCKVNKMIEERFFTALRENGYKIVEENTDKKTLKHCLIGKGDGYFEDFHITDVDDLHRSVTNETTFEYSRGGVKFLLTDCLLYYKHNSEHPFYYSLINNVYASIVGIEKKEVFELLDKLYFKAMLSSKIKTNEQPTVLMKI